MAIECAFRSYAQPFREIRCGLRVGMFTSKNNAQIGNDARERSSKIYRFIPKNSQEIHYLAYWLLERSHLQRIGCVKGTQSGYVELILIVDWAYILFSKSRKIADQ